MAGFKIKRDPSDKGSKKVPISSQTVLIGDLLELTAGATTWAVCTSSSNFFTRKAIAQEAASSSDTEVLVKELDGNEDVEVESANSSDSTHNGDRMALTDKNTVNNSGSDVTGQAVAFVQDGTIGATTDNRIVGRVLVGNGVDPDAA
jgi:hypothetical protein